MGMDPRRDRLLSGDTPSSSSSDEGAGVSGVFGGPVEASGGGLCCLFCVWGWGCGKEVLE